MTYSLLNEFTGSSLFPAKRWLDKEDFSSLSEKAYVLILALRMALCLPSTKKWADDFIKHTMINNHFKSWRANGSDLYVVMWALTQGEYEPKRHEPDSINDAPFVRWMRTISHNHDDISETKRLFLKMDSVLHINESSLKAIRRLVQEWPELSHYDKQLAMTRLLQILRARMPRAEILKHLSAAARKHDLEISGVCNKETGHGCNPSVDDLFHKKEQPTKGFSFLAGLAGFGAGYSASKTKNENATAGATGAASVASVVTALGDHSGFDKDGDHGVYTKKKPIVLKR